MQRAILIGDSIRVGYQPHVAEALAPDVQVWGPEANGGTSANVLAHLEPWALLQQADVIHVNAGLHDLKRLADPSRPDVALDAYRDNVRAILTRLRDQGSAPVIWAQTTPVDYQRHHDNKGFDRFEEDVTAYNRAAAEVAGELDVPINDLYTGVMRAGRDDLLVEDGVHFTPEGYRRLGEQVARAIRQRLGEAD